MFTQFLLFVTFGSHPPPTPDRGLGSLDPSLLHFDSKNNRECVRVSTSSAVKFQCFLTQIASRGRDFVGPSKSLHRHD